MPSAVPATSGQNAFERTLRSMTTRNLDALFEPKSIALMDASNQPRSVGAVTAKNLYEAGFVGPIVTVNPHEQTRRVETAGAEDQLGVTYKIAWPLERRCVAFAHETLEGLGHLLDETMLLDFVPVGRLHRASSRRLRRHKAAPGTIGSLLMRRRVLDRRYVDGLQVGEFLVALVVEKQRLSAVADENNTL